MAESRRHWQAAFRWVPQAETDSRRPPAARPTKHLQLGDLALSRLIITSLAKRRDFPAGP